MNYVVVASLDDLTVSITVPAGTAPGPQQLSVTDGTITHTLAEAIRIVDGTIANPSPALMGLGESTILTFPAHPLLQGQTFFSLDLGPDVAVGPLSLQDNGTLRAPVSVLTSAIPGTRSVHLTAGPYSILAERGFAIDFGPPVNNYTLNVPGGNLSQFKVQVPAGYMAAVFAAPGSSKRIFFPGGLYVDEHNHLFVLNHGLVSSLVDVPFFVSVWDLNPANFGAFLGIISHLEIDPTGTDNGVLEKGRMLPNRPGTLYLSTEDDAIQGFPGGRRIYAVDTNTNTSSVFLDNPDWNLDPIETDVRGNLIIGNRVDSIGQLDVTLLDSQANIIKVCVPNNYFGDTLSLDPLSGEYLYENLKGASMLDFSACSSRPRDLCRLPRRT